ncbi:MAG: HAD-IB family hydrolase [Oceanospirillaceae bacterium]|nr:HAD-IB family hydrolase [Oceanospirillaceae bacterium]
MSLAIFDLDETLIRGDTASLFCRFMVDTGLADGTFVDREQELMQRYADETLSMPEYVAFMLKPLRQLDVDQVNALMPRFVDDCIAHRIYPQAHSLIAHQRAVGRHPLIISATPEFLVRAVARALAVDDVLAINLEVDESQRYSGAIQGIPTYREGKVHRLLDWLKETGHTLENARFYSDSINDLPLLECVEYPFCANPDPRLTAVARQRGWPVMHWNDIESVGYRAEESQPSGTVLYP